MRPLAREEIVPLAVYASVRDSFRSAVIAHKRGRRLAVGPSVTLVFEDRETLRFQVQEMLWVERIAEPGRYAAIRISHPNYAHEAEFPPAVRESLLAGLRADPDPLVPPLPAAGTPAEPEVLYASGDVRVVRPVTPQLPGHLIVESSATLESTGEIDPVLWNALGEVVRRTASDLAQRHGGCRVVADFAPGAPLRWHILPRPGGSSSANRT